MSKQYIEIVNRASTIIITPKIKANLNLCMRLTHVSGPKVQIIRTAIKKCYTLPRVESTSCFLPALMVLSILSITNASIEIVN